MSGVSRASSGKKSNADPFFTWEQTNGFAVVDYQDQLRDARLQ